MSELRTGGLDAGYNDKPLLRDISLEVKPGTIVTLIGPNGAGKSTILKTVAGFLRPISGAVYIDGRDTASMTPSDKAKKLSVMLTGRNETEYATCFDVVSVGRYQFTGIMGRLSEADIRAVDEALSCVHAEELRDARFSKLSDGQKQRVLLARALVQKPGVMILDEPTSFLDIGYKLEFMEILRGLAKDKKIGILMSLHELELVKAISDRVIAISGDNRIDKTGTPDEIFEASYIESLYHIKPGRLGTTYGFLAPDTLRPRGRNSETGDVCISNKKAGTKFLMVQGTMSSAGKSLIAAGLCRIFKQDGYRVAPFKSQNMALNSFITEEGLEMGRAQVMQAEAAGIKPHVCMNPILLKPTDDVGSQVIVNGKVLGNMRARDYFKFKTSLIPEIMKAVETIKTMADIVVIEGAGSPAEINLKENDIVNMGMARLVDAPVLLVGDIDRGGVFAQLLGTIELLEEEERARIKGLVVNKFRGDKTILDPGVAALEERSGIPVAGVVPYMNLCLDDEDSLTERFARKTKGELEIGVIRLPHISNFTDFDVFDQIPEVSVRYIQRSREFGEPDLLIIPGSKNTIADMKWLRESGLEVMIGRLRAKGHAIIGICGGYQMLGSVIEDPHGMEAGGMIRGLGLLPVRTVIKESKHRSQVEGRFTNPTGLLKELSGARFQGYEIHMGETAPESEEVSEFTPGGSGYCAENVYGTYVHGLFDNKEAASGLVRALAKRRGIDLDMGEVLNYAEVKEQEYDRLAAILRGHMDMKLIYDMLGIVRKADHE